VLEVDSRFITVSIRDASGEQKTGQHIKNQMERPSQESTQIYLSVLNACWSFIRSHRYTCNKLQEGRM